MHNNVFFFFSTKKKFFFFFLNEHNNVLVNKHMSMRFFYIYILNIYTNTYVFMLEIRLCKFENNYELSKYYLIILI